MKIKMNQSLVGPGLRLVRGCVYDLPTDTASKYVASRLATVVQAVSSTPPERREKATRKSKETR